MTGVNLGDGLLLQSVPLSSRSRYITRFVAYCEPGRNGLRRFGVDRRQGAVGRGPRPPTVSDARRAARGADGSRRDGRVRELPTRVRRARKQPLSHPPCEIGEKSREGNTGSLARNAGFRGVFETGASGKLL